MASNGTVQAKTWNPNGLAAVANLPCGSPLASDFCFPDSCFEEHPLLSDFSCPACQLFSFCPVLPISAFQVSTRIPVCHNHFHQFESVVFGVEDTGEPGSVRAEWGRPIPGVLRPTISIRVEQTEEKRM